MMGSRTSDDRHIPLVTYQDRPHTLNPMHPPLIMRFALCRCRSWVRPPVEEEDDS
jgi:hypothetical protein